MSLYMAASFADLVCRTCVCLRCIVHRSHRRLAHATAHRPVHVVVHFSTSDNYEHHAVGISQQLMFLSIGVTPSSCSAFGMSRTLRLRARGSDKLFRCKGYAIVSLPY